MTSFQNSKLKREAFLLKRIMKSVVIIMTVTLLLSIYFQPAFLYRNSLALMLLGFISVVSFILLKKGLVKESAFLYVGFLMLVIFGFSFTGGGIRAHGMKLLPIIVLFAGLTLGKREIWIFGIIASMGGIILVGFDYYHLIPVTEPISNAAIIYWIFLFASIFLLCSFENLSMQELYKALNESDKSLNLHLKSEEQLKKQNEKLIEIAFLQSHLVRKPVANVIGLINLIDQNKGDEQLNLEVIAKLRIVVKELDESICEIVENTNGIEALVKKGG